MGFVPEQSPGKGALAATGAPRGGRRQVPRSFLGVAYMPAPADLEPRLVSVKDAVRITGICKSTLYQLVRDGKLKPAKFGTKTLFSYAEVCAFTDSILASRDENTTTPVPSNEVPAHTATTRKRLTRIT